MKHGPRTILLKLLTILLSGSPFRWWTRQQLTAGLIPQQSQLKKLMSPARRPFRAISARTVELAGTNQFQMFATVSIKNSRGDQAINPKPSTDGGGCAPAIWFFQDHKWKQRHDPSFKPQAPSVKHHAPIFRKLQAASIKHQAPQVPSDKLRSQSSKPQASSHKQQAP